MTSAQELASAVALTTTPTASTNVAKVSGLSKHTIYLYWTPGTSGNVLTVTVETRSVNAANSLSWTPVMSWSSGAGTKSLQSFVETASGTSEVPLEIALERTTQEIRIKYSESEAGSATKGTISAYILSCC